MSIALLTPRLRSQNLWINPFKYRSLLGKYCPSSSLFKRKNMNRFLGCLFLFLYGLSSQAAIEKKPIVQVTDVSLIELSESLTYPARVEPRISASVTAETEGIVTKIIAPLGSSVHPRTALLVIRNTDPVYHYSPMVVTSPVTGIVSKVEVTEGSRVSRGDRLALVTDPKQLRVVVEVTAQDLSLVKPGQEAELNVPGQPTFLAMKLRVRGVSPFVDPATGTAQCELELAPKQEKGALLPPPGVIARVQFKANIRKGFSISDNALIYRGKDPFVRVVENGKAKFVLVTIGRKQSGFVEIVKGLKSGDRVVERSSGFVADGDLVEIEKAPDKASTKSTAPSEKI
jgi:multidrug efflux pump subunit AcrA (membrane-fusion protein)